MPSAMTQWDSGVERIEGRIAAGGDASRSLVGQPGRAFPVVVSEWNEPRDGVDGRDAARPVHGHAHLHADAGRRHHTTFTMREEFSGPLRPLIARSMPDLGPSFEQFARGLKARPRRRQIEEAKMSGRFIDGVGTAATRGG